MVVFIDHGRSVYSHFRSGGDVDTLLKDADVLPLKCSSDAGLRLTPFLPPDHGADDSSQSTTSEETNPNADHGFAAALSCYPVATEIARSVDLNTLHALSGTCRQIHGNLMQFRNQLVKETLRCRNEKREDESSSGNESITVTVNGVTGKGNRCARDMVGECQRCARFVCRNCTMKVPSTQLLKGRLRRLCHTCLAVPLSHHFRSHSPPHDEPDHTTSSHAPLEPWPESPCSCETQVWLCKPCGQTLRSEDTSYRRVWTWRTRYSAYLGGGLGTGIVECQGVKCGRGEGCLAAEDIELEIDCDVDDWASEHSDHSSSSHHSQHHHHHPHHHHHHGHHSHHSHSYHQDHGDHRTGEGRDDEEPGYLRQEIEGVGGVVKQKVKKRVRVGASVEEVGRERETGVYLKPEASGDVRSWCAWCSRVMPSNSEQAELK